MDTRFNSHLYHTLVGVHYFAFFVTPPPHAHTVTHFLPFFPTLAFYICAFTYSSAICTHSNSILLYYGGVGCAILIFWWFVAGVAPSLLSILPVLLVCLQLFSPSLAWTCVAIVLDTITRI